MQAVPLAATSPIRRKWSAENGTAGEVKNPGWPCLAGVAVAAATAVPFLPELAGEGLALFKRIRFIPDSRSEYIWEGLPLLAGLKALCCASAAWDRQGNRHRSVA